MLIRPHSPQTLYHRRVKDVKIPVPDKDSPNDIILGNKASHLLFVLAAADCEEGFEGLPQVQCIQPVPPRDADERIN